MHRSGLQLLFIVPSLCNAACGPCSQLKACILQEVFYAQVQAHRWGSPSATFDLKLSDEAPGCPSHPLVCHVSGWGLDSLSPTMHLYLQLVLWSELVLGEKLCCVSQISLWVICQNAPSKHFMISAFGLEIWTGSQAVWLR